MSGGPESIGAEIRRAVFRDTRTFYCAPIPLEPSPSLIRFVRQQAGPRVLDLGCAAGAYCVALGRLGFEVTGADINPEYVRLARARGVDAHQTGEALPFADAAFDTTLLFEVLEHVADPHPLLREVRRVSRRNVLITVPNCESAEELRASGVLPEHFGDVDHRNFFTPGTLDALLRAHFRTVAVTRGDPLNPFALAGRRWIRRLGTLGQRLRLVPARCYFRLYAVAAI